jgi:hypothetical protein
MGCGREARSLEHVRLDGIDGAVEIAELDQRVRAEAFQHGALGSCIDRKPGQPVLARPRRERIGAAT